MCHEYVKVGQTEKHSQYQYSASINVGRRLILIYLHTFEDLWMAFFYKFL